MEHVRGDLGTQLDDLEFGLDPRHCASNRSVRVSTDNVQQMEVEVTAGEPIAVGADLVAVGAGPRAAELGAPERAVAAADPVAMVYATGAPLAVVALEPGAEGLRTGAAHAVRACRDGGTVAWALDASLPVPVSEQVRALA